jgi:hypothetical protein
MEQSANSLKANLHACLAHANELSRRIRESIAAPAPAARLETERLRGTVTRLVGLIDNEIEPLAERPNENKSLPASGELAVVFANLRYRVLEFKALWASVCTEDEAIQKSIADLKTAADNVVETVALVTVPWLLTERLTRMNSGAALLYDAVAKEWIDSESIRDRIWHHLLQFRFFVPNGLADQDTRLIFECSTLLPRRIASLAVLATLIAVASWILLKDPTGGLGRYLKFDSALLHPWYWWVLTGIGIQGVVRAIGENRSKGFPPFSEVRDWIHVKEVSVGVSIVGAFLAAILLAGGSEVSAKNVGVLSAISTGYAMDHLIKSLASRMPTILGGSAELASLKKRIGL